MKIEQPTIDQVTELTKIPVDVQSVVSSIMPTGTRLVLFTLDEFDLIVDSDVWLCSYILPDLSGFDLVRGSDKIFKTSGYRMLVLKPIYAAKMGDTIAVFPLMGDDDVIRFMQVNGMNYGVTNEDIVAFSNRLKGITEDLTIMGITPDSIYFSFSRLNYDISKLVKEIYKICNDVIDQGYGSVKQYAKEILSSNSIYLWWD